MLLVYCGEGFFMLLLTVEGRDLERWVALDPDGSWSWRSGYINLMHSPSLTQYALALSAHTHSVQHAYSFKGCVVAFAGHSWSRWNHHPEHHSSCSYWYS